MHIRLALGLLLVLALGCGSEPKIVAVSGKVTLNGKPLAKASVSFQPIAPEGSVEAGPGSQATTNDNGEFDLHTSTGLRGAIEGKHRVLISLVDSQIAEHDTRPPRGGWPLADKVPKRYNVDSKQTFEIPRGGTDKADFALTSP